jgi:predicted enzyme related to lactoylglutathione lyase
MLARMPVTVMMPAQDLGRADNFYHKVLGLPIAKNGNADDVIAFEAGQGTLIALYEHAPTKAEHTVANWLVDNIDATVDELSKRGVVFEQYDVPGLKTDARGIAVQGPSRSAWFKDTEGNILAITQI